MSQTMYAIIALVIIALFVVHERRKALQVQTAMVHNAVAAIGNGVAVERMSQIRAMSFDQETREGFLTSPTQLTASDDFGPGRDVENDDVDDFHGATKDVYRVVGTDTLTFRAESKVRYVEESELEEDGSTSSSQNTLPTKYKRVTVKVYSVGLHEAQVDTVWLSQTISCKNACNWTSNDD